jgi:formate dehydrogenase
MIKLDRKADRAAAKPKGRVLDEAALRQVEAWLAGLPRRRDLLIEALHRVQDAAGCLHARHLKALAECFRMAQAEVFQVASFYHHFDIVKEGGGARRRDGARLRFSPA